MKEKNPNTILSMFAVVVVAILCQSNGVETPALAYIAQDFATVPMTTIVMISTLPGLMLIPASLLFSAFRSKLKLRSAFIAGMILLIIGGVMPAFSYSIGAILFWRCVFGLGLGVMWPLSYSLIVEMYSGNRQDTLIGLNSTVTAVGGIIWAMLGGSLALISWRYSFYAYFIPIIILLFCGFLLPEPKKIDKNEPVSSDEPQKAKVGLLLFCYIAVFFYNAAAMTYFTNLSLKVVGEGLGNSAAAGGVQSMWVIGSLIVGILFGFIMRSSFMKKYGVGICWIFTAIGVYMVGTATSLPMALAGSLIAGAGTGIVMPALVGMVGSAAGKKHAAVFLGIFTTVMGLAQFCGPMILNGLVAKFQLTYGSFPITASSYVHLIAAIIALIALIIMAKNQKIADQKSIPISK